MRIHWIMGITVVLVTGCAAIGSVDDEETPMFKLDLAKPSQVFGHLRTKLEVTSHGAQKSGFSFRASSTDDSTVNVVKVSLWVKGGKGQGFLLWQDVKIEKRDAGAVTWMSCLHESLMPQSGFRIYVDGPSPGKVQFDLSLQDSGNKQEKPNNEIESD